MAKIRCGSEVRLGANFFCAAGAIKIALVCALGSVSTVVNATTGEFAVDPSGAATYAIPVPVPPGRNDIQPKLSLRYSSQGGNGLVGLGWNISGLSSITRCPQTMNEDGEVKPVSYSANDRYCLDGQRLMVVGGAYGADGSEYRTRIDGYSRIRAFSAVGVANGPAKFVVTTREGVTMVYGDTSQSRVFATAPNGSSVAIWALNQVTDPKGNVMTVSYNAPDAITGQHYPVQIDYAPNVSVIFDYQAGRPDVVTSHVNGSISSITNRLTKIRTVKDAAQIGQMELAYQNLAASGASRLSSIKWCMQGSCMPGLNLGLSDAASESTGLVVNSAGGLDWGHSDRRWWNDVNGDGLVDYCRASGNVSGSGSYLDCSISDGNGGFSSLTRVTSIDWGYPDRRWWIDVTGDGLVDYCRATGNESGSGSYLDCSISNGGGNFSSLAHVSTIDWGHSDRRWWIDVTGDGIVDYCRATGNSLGSGSYLDCSISNGSGNFSSLARVSTIDWGHSDRRWWIDVSGDGIVDYCRATGDPVGIGSYLDCSISNGSGNFSSLARVTNIDWGHPDRRWWHDVNGDGIVDYCRATGNESGSGSYLDCSISNGKGNFSSLKRVSSIDWGYSDRRWWVDVSGDGIVDYCRAVGTGSTMTCSISNGQGGFARHVSATISDWGHSDRRWWNDVYGTGRSAYCRAVGDAVGSVQCTSFFGANYTESVKSFQTLATLNIHYNSLVRMEPGQQYVRNASVAVPRRVYGGAVPVVSHTLSSDGVGGQRETRYGYGNLIWEGGLAGNGSLGFQWTQTKDVSTGLVSRTYYRQDFPYIGMVDKTGKGTSEANWSNLSLSTNEYKFMSFAANDANYGSPTTCADDPATGKTSASCPSTAIQPGRRYVPYAWKSLSKAWDWNEATSGLVPLPHTRTTITQDNWGNATEVYVETIVSVWGLATGYTKKTESVYAPADTVNWKSGRLLKSSVTTTSP